MYFSHSLCFLCRFIIYKLPRYKIGEVGSGVDYMYLDSSVGNWQMSKFMVNTSQGALGSTLNQLYLGKAYKVSLSPCSSSRFYTLIPVCREIERPVALITLNGAAARASLLKTLFCFQWGTKLKLDINKLSQPEEVDNTGRPHATYFLFFSVTLCFCSIGTKVYKNQILINLIHFSVLWLVATALKCFTEIN